MVPLPGYPGRDDKSRLQSSTRIVSAAASPRQSKFQEKQTQKGKNSCRNFQKGTFPAAKRPKSRAPSPEAAKEYSLRRKPWVETENPVSPEGEKEKLRTSTPGRNRFLPTLPDHNIDIIDAKTTLDKLSKPGSRLHPYNRRACWSPISITNCPKN